MVAAPPHRAGPVGHSASLPTSLPSPTHACPLNLPFPILPPTLNPRRSLPQTLADAKERGWQVLGAAAEAGAVSAAGFVLRRPAILVMGNEGYGLRTMVRRLCDATLQVKPTGTKYAAAWFALLRRRYGQRAAEGMYRACSFQRRLGPLPPAGLPNFLPSPSLPPRCRLMMAALLRAGRRWWTV
jgi:hypothetical protein